MTLPAALRPLPRAVVSNTAVPFRRPVHPIPPRIPSPRRRTFTRHLQSQAQPQPAKVLQAGFGWTSLVVAAALSISAAALYTQYSSSTAAASSSPSHSSEPRDKPSTATDELSRYLADMATQIPPGRPGNLTADQEAKLREMWTVLFKLFGIQEPHLQAVPRDPHSNGKPKAMSRTSTDTGYTGATGNTAGKEGKKKRFGVFSKKDKNKHDSTDDSVRDAVRPPTAGSSGAPMGADAVVSGLDLKDDKHGQIQEFKAAMASMEPQEIRTTMWEMTKHDHPDGLMLRFLRARKWDVQKAIVMMISTMHWRLKDSKVDSDIMLHGEEGMMKAARGEMEHISVKDGEDFMAQIRLGKSFLRGVDKMGRPMCFVRVRLHRAGEQSEPSLERYTVYTIETARMFLKPPVDTATIVFDMTGFSLSNMDYAPVKFMIKCFEANYPESLGAVLVHQAPWLFGSIWRVIKGWLDPVVASKIHFTKTLKDLEEFVPPESIIKELGGTVDWEYHYVEPVPGENSKMEDVETRERIKADRHELVKQYEAKTLEWIYAYQRSAGVTGEEAARFTQERHDIARGLHDNYWKLDPYVRARSLHDRTDMVKKFTGEIARNIDDDDDDEEEPDYVTAPGTPIRHSVDVRRSVDLRRSLDIRPKLNGTAS